MEHLEKADQKGCEAGMECTSITCTVRNARPVESRLLFALVDVDVEIAGVTIAISGVQARRLTSGGTSVHLPTYKGPDGIWYAAVTVPDEVRAPLTRAVLEVLVEEGLARPRYCPPKR